MRIGKAYLVGGAVRDALLGEGTHQDRDWVVVGASPQAMLDAGFLPVGADFPVFLHPTTHEEYALARTERKSGSGYHGFCFHASPEVTLEQDLLRRDLSINAMAMDVSCEPPVLIDPYNGQVDLQSKTLRHVSAAFAEDPVRLLRVARFAARLEGFHVAEETLALMQHMVQSEEVNALVAERVWQELRRGLMGRKPSRMLQVLRACGALKVLMPELDALWGVPQSAQHHPEIDTGVHTMLVLDTAAALNAPLAVRMACLLHDLGKGATAKEAWPRHIGHEAKSVPLLRAVCARWRVPTHIQQLSELVAREHGNIHRSSALGAAALYRLLMRVDAIRRPERFALILQACVCDARGRLGFEQSPYPQGERLALALQAAQAVDAQSIAQAAIDQGLKAQAIGARIEHARIAAIAATIESIP